MAERFTLDAAILAINPVPRTWSAIFIDQYATKRPINITTQPHSPFTAPHKRTSPPSPPLSRIAHEHRRKQNRQKCSPLPLHSRHHFSLALYTSHTHTAFHHSPVFNPPVIHPPPPAQNVHRNIHPLPPLPTHPLPSMGLLFNSNTDRPPPFHRPRLPKVQTTPQRHTQQLCLFRVSARSSDC